ncbi:Formylglycine-generating enzyme, required for sulfatase activity, contains SUMF1/FGE domain [Nitrosomonas marina]|uniref:Formylglycine-generating enzyme, required for sulfatase activity, contains SUMF1/FGE domain n=1 Tax=Nitrosomonas marina TaxID=917 RepID=A0A1H9Z5A2_9PROT|nr:formylglycine-generating enzyme family protein [Nitrosomonas marina]SES76707.1 Formylglycine-generating enzyme, required for sulfatase activity, contains SUMF1/FGE domain [Nitrosomonas marina]
MVFRKHTIFPEEFPEAWASDWGEDEYGLWMAFTYKDVRQVFRWCEPGTFLMGSPNDEPERDDDELQHEVTLTKGFWIADTPVTQALWTAVMGEDDQNPSPHFPGDDRPVENVSWDDAQAFIDTMNGLKAELKLCLPTEAQWEYACRAGTTTPFSWGDQIDSSLVNFKANRPYFNGRNSEYRKHTINVKALPCNNWGLYQMHGNVFEWCQDWYGEYPLTPVTDPRGPQSWVGRVLRGGSWFLSGRFCRSASRHRFAPSIRRVNYGFRLSR